MDYIPRMLENQIQEAVKRKKSVLLLGARQTGKSTLLKQLTNQLKISKTISFILPEVRQRYEQNLALLTGEIESLAETNKVPLIVIDEVQKIPAVLDTVQDFIDRNRAQFILTGSSARKLRKGTHVNLLPGRVVVLRLDPLILSEIPNQYQTLEELLLFGSLPGILLTETEKNKEIDLRSYVTTYLEEEIRSESIVRHLGSFAQFLSLAASESGNIVSFRKLSQEIGVAHTTIAAYYETLIDCLVAECVLPLIHTKTRRKLLHAPKYLFFDMGIRRICANEGRRLPEKYLGMLFEQWVGLELIRRARLSQEGINILFWRDATGSEIDWIVEIHKNYLPIEVKWTSKPTLNDAKYLRLFLSEYSNAEKAYVICRTPTRVKLANQIYAIPWQDIDEILC